MSNNLSTNVIDSTNVIEVSDGKEEDPIRAHHVARGTEALYDIVKAIKGLIAVHLGDLNSINNTPVFQQLGGNMEVYPHMSDSQAIFNLLTHYQYATVGIDTGEFNPRLLKNQLDALVEWMEDHPFEPRQQINILADKPFPINPVPLIDRLKQAIIKAEGLGLFLPERHAGTPSLERDTIDAVVTEIAAPASQIVGPTQTIATSPPVHTR